jgi:hypothetical protein
MEFTIGTGGSPLFSAGAERVGLDLGQIEILNRIAISVELEWAAHRLEIGLVQCPLRH